jgi:hypothetical protein
MGHGDFRRSEECPRLISFSAYPVVVNNKINCDEIGKITGLLRVYRGQELKISSLLI